MSQESNDHARLETFCDGVFAIAITLLILEIKIAPVSSIHSIAEFWIQLAHDWASWFGFTLSFIIILVAWVNHHSSFKLITKSSMQFVYANGFLLFTIVVLPFSTGLMSEYLGTEYSQPACTVYCFSVLLHNISWIVFGISVYHPHDLTRDQASSALLRNAIVKNSRQAFFLYLGMCVLSFWFPLSAMILMTASWIIWIFTGMMLTNKK